MSPSEMQRARHAALFLHGLDAETRRHVMASLEEHERSEMASRLEELRRLGGPAAAFDRALAEVRSDDIDPTHDALPRWRIASPQAVERCLQRRSDLACACVLQGLETRVATEILTWMSEARRSAVERHAKRLEGRLSVAVVKRLVDRLEAELAALARDAAAQPRSRNRWKAWMR